MINKMTNKLGLFILVLTLSLVTNAQSNSDNSPECKENATSYTDSFKQKNYADALNPWRWIFLNCPTYNLNVYKRGPKIIKERMKVDKKNKSAYVDTLMMIFDQRILHFGKEGYVLGLKGFELINTDKSRAKEALGYLQSSLDLEGGKASVQAVYGYMQTIVALQKSGIKTNEDVLSAYAKISEIIQFNLKNQSKSTKHFVKYSQKIEDLFTPYANCEALITLFSKSFDPLSEDIEALKRITKLLDDKKCTDSELFFSASSRLHELSPSALSADKMAKMSIFKGRRGDAVDFAKKAVEMEEDADQKAIYYLGLAYYKIGFYNKYKLLHLF